MVLFDITAYFPSVPLEKASCSVREGLDKQNINPMLIKAHFELTNLCMKQTYFGFNSVFYQQTDGTAMSNPLTPFARNIPVNALEEIY